MKKIDILGIAFGNFKRRKMRSVLTVLGVVIGTASIVTMMSLGIAIDKSFSDSVGDTTSLTTVNVNPGYDNQTGQQMGNMDDELVKQLSAMEHVLGVSPEINLGGKMIAGKYLAYSQIVGVDMKFAKQLGIDKIATGTSFTDETLSSGKNIYAIFGSETAYQFEKPRRGGGGMMGGSISMGGDGTEKPPPDVDVMSPETKIKYTYDWSYGENNPSDTSVKKKPVLYNIKPVGVLEGGNWDSRVYIDIETAKRLKKEMEKFQASQNGGGTTGKKQTKQTYDGLKVFADDMENTIALTKQINEMGLQAYSDAEWISKEKEKMAMIQMLLGGIGSVSLLVAAIGITNTMIMSIYERTREIGIMKVIGCYLKDIRTMFLVEAGFIGLFGGAVGVGLSYGLSAVMNFLVKSGAENGGGGSILGMGGGNGAAISLIPPWLAFLAIGFAIIVALVSGFFPARRAMKLSALEAMRT